MQSIASESQNISIKIHHLTGDPTHKLNEPNNNFKAMTVFEMSKLLSIYRHSAAHTICEVMVDCLQAIQRSLFGFIYFDNLPFVFV